jgi:hypothetical protein
MREVLTDAPPECNRTPDRSPATAMEAWSQALFPGRWIFKDGAALAIERQGDHIRARSARFSPLRES